MLNVRREAGFESRAINMETREHIKIIMGSRSPSGLPGIVEVPSMPERPGQLSDLEASEPPHHEQQARHQSQAELEVARGELQALDHLLELEEAKLAELQRSSASRHSVDFIKLARQEVESEYERLENFFKRRQNMANQRSNTFDSGIADMSVAGSPRLGADESLRQPSSPGNEQSRGTGNIFSVSRSPPEHSTSTTAVQSRLGREASENLSASGTTSQSSTARRGGPRRSRSIDSLSKTKDRYLARFERELAEIEKGDQLSLLPDPVIDPNDHPPDSEDPIDQRVEIEDGISRTRRELFELVQRSFPPSPNIGISSKGSPNATGQSSVSSPSPSIGMQHRPSFPTSIMSAALEINSWKWVAKDVAVAGLQYSCGKCRITCPTGLQYARRSTNGLSFRMLCTTSYQARSDALLLRHDLSSSTNPLPHITHSRADPSNVTCILVKGSNKRLEFYNRGSKYPLHLSTQVRYQFKTADDSEFFQQLVFGMKLSRKFDIRAVSSSLDSGPTRFETLRIWQDIRSDELVLMTHGNLVAKHDPLIFYEKRSAFASANPSGERKVKLSLAESNRPKPRSRRLSRDSGVSGFSWSSGESQSGSQTIKWLEVEFDSTEDRGEFLTMWTPGGT